MGEVWLAEAATAFGVSRPVAIKVIGGDRTDRRARALFYDEARVMTRIQSAHVVQALELGEHEERLFIVLEWIDGASLSQLLSFERQRGTTLPLDVVLAIAVDVTEGLRAAHSLVGEDGVPLGLVHRDISPQNVLVGRDGVAKVADFGIARMRGRLAGASGDSGLKGKINYLSPEQLREEDVDARADLWSLGLVLWEALAGSLPFPSDSGPAALAWLLKVDVAPSPPPEWPGPVKAIFDRLLAPDPRARFSSADELATALRDAAVKLGIVLDRRRVGVLVDDVAPRSTEKRFSGTPPPNTATPGDRAPATSAPIAPPSLLRRALATTAVVAIAAAVSVGVTSLVGSAGDGTRTTREPRIIDREHRAQLVLLGAESHLARRSAPPTTAPPTAPPPARPAASRCSPPFVVDAAGHKIYLPECLDHAK